MKIVEKTKKRKFSPAPICAQYNTYSSVPNRRAVRNKRAGGKILEKH